MSQRKEQTIEQGYINEWVKAKQGSDSKNTFISHSSRDTVFAKAFKKDLFEYGIVAWLDETELLLGDQLTKKITDAIEHFDYLAIVISSHSVQSEWVKKELKIAKENGKEILPILLEKLEKVEIPSDIQDNIGGQVYADFTNPDLYASSFQKFLQLLGHKTPVKDKLIIFSNSLALGWETANWGCILYEKLNLYEGKHSICARVKKFGGLAFRFRSGVDTTGYDKLEFYINGGDVGGQNLKVYMNVESGNGVKKSVSLDPLLPKEWRYVSVPLVNLETTRTTILKINISEEAGNDTPDFYLCDLCLRAS